jgi:hypothetical protein
VPVGNYRYCLQPKEQAATLLADYKSNLISFTNIDSKLEKQDNESYRRIEIYLKNSNLDSGKQKENDSEIEKMGVDGSSNNKSYNQNSSDKSSKNGKASGNKKDKGRKNFGRKRSMDVDSSDSENNCQKHVEKSRSEHSSEREKEKIEEKQKEKQKKRERRRSIGIKMARMSVMSINFFLRN